MKENCNRDFRREFLIKEDDQVIVFTGRLLKEKGIYELIEAVEQFNKTHKPVYLMIAGEGEEKEYVESHKSEYIIPLGRLQFQDVIALLEQSDIFCLPSVSEGLSTSALEAAACKCYVITTERGGTKELVIDEDHGIVMRDNSVNNIYKAIEKVTSDEELRKKGQDLCYNRLENKFTWEHTTDNLERIIKK